MFTGDTDRLPFQHLIDESSQSTSVIEVAGFAMD